MATTLLDYVLKNDQHLGHLIFSTFKSSPEVIFQVDAATGEKETKESALSRIAGLARSLRNFGLQPGDVVAISGKNHLDIHIPYYVGNFNGYPICGVDNTFKYDEVKNVLKVVLPKVAFCDGESYEIFKQVVQDLNLDTTVIKFGKGENSLQEFVEKYDKNPSEEYKVAEYDVDKVYFWLPATSGSTGIVKVAAIKQSQILIKIKTYLKSLLMLTTSIPQERVNTLNVGPIHWLTGIFNAMLLPMLNHCKIQTSGPVEADHLIDIINEYKPVTLLTSPAVLTSLFNSEKPCDFSSFRTITATGSKLQQEIYDKVCSKIPKESFLLDMYSQTESIGPILTSDPFGPREAFVLLPSSQYETKLVDPDTETEITEPLKSGELWVRGPLFTEYYRNPVETKKALTEDGWYKSGDIFRKDEAGRFYYVERLKTLIKYRNYHVIPAELEDVIRQHPGVGDVVVTSVPNDEVSELPVACIVKKNGVAVSAKEIIDLVADKLSDGKRLRGGVLFLDSIPTTSTGKIALGKLKQIVLQAEREF